MSVDPRTHRPRLGELVRYHGSIPDAHGTYRLDSACPCDRYAEETTAPIEKGEDR